MQNQFSRTQLLLGKPAMKTLADARIAVFGVGGVGGYVVEVLARSGVGALDLYDDDCVSPTNLNRQIIALHSTIGQTKVDVAAARVLDINPDCHVQAHKMFYIPQNADEIDLSQFDYVADCIDTVSAKIELVKRCHALHIPLISSMGAANKLDPTCFSVTDLSKTKMDPIAKIMRKKLRKEGITHLKVVYSSEDPLTPLTDTAAEVNPDADIINAGMSDRKEKRITPASNAFVPSVAGMIMGGEIIKDLIHAARTMRITENEDLGIVP